MELPIDSAIRIVELQDRENYQRVVDFLEYASLIPDDIDRLYAKRVMPDSEEGESAWDNLSIGVDCD